MSEKFKPPIDQIQEELPEEKTEQETPEKFIIDKDVEKTAEWIQQTINAKIQRGGYFGYRLKDNLEEIIQHINKIQTEESYIYSELDIAEIGAMVKFRETKIPQKFDKDPDYDDVIGYLEFKHRTIIRYTSAGDGYGFRVEWYEEPLKEALKDYFEDSVQY